MKLREYLVQKLIEAFAYVKSEETDFTSESVSIKGKPPVYLELSGIISLVNAAAEIPKERKDIGENFTSENIQEMLKDILIEASTDKPKNLESYLNEKIGKFLDGLKKEPSNFTFFIPTQNIELDVPKFGIGDVSFIKLTQEKLDDIYSRYWKNEFLESRLKEREGKVVAEISNVFAVTKDKAKEKAFITLEKVLNAIRTIHPFPEIWIMGEFSPSIRNIFYFDTTNKSFGEESRYIGLESVTNPLKLDARIISWMETQSLDAIKKLFSISNPNKFQKNLLTAIHWFGESKKDKNLADSFIKLFVSLEALFIVDKYEAKEKIAERAAFLIGGDKEERVRIYEEMRKFLKLRNSIIHEGRTDIAASDLNWVSQYTRNSILKLAKKIDEFRDMNDLKKFIDDMKFS